RSRSGCSISFSLKFCSWSAQPGSAPPLNSDRRIYFFGCSPFCSSTFLRRRSSFIRSEEHTSELQSRFDLVCRLLLEKKKHIRSLVRRELAEEPESRAGALLRFSNRARREPAIVLEADPLGSHSPVEIPLHEKTTWGE